MCSALPQITFGKKVIHTIFDSKHKNFKSLLKLYSFSTNEIAGAPFQNQGLLINIHFELF